jgi:hypothetical protein
MSIYRFSATEMFGVPIDAGSEILKNTRAGAGLVVQLMGQYSIEGALVQDKGPTNITPPYWRKNNMEYLMTLEDSGVATVHLMPKHADTETVDINITPFVTSVGIGIRTVQITPEQPAFILVGNSPRFEEPYCLHEAVVSLDD